MNLFRSVRAPLCALVALVALYSIAVAAPIAVHRAETPSLTFRTHKAALGDNFDFMGGYVDSNVATRLGTAVAPLCTTLAVPTKGWATVQNQALGDTSGFFCQLNIWDATGTACDTIVDSIYVAVQGSHDGRTWATMAPFLTSAPTSLNNRLSQAVLDGSFYVVQDQNHAEGATLAPMWCIPYKLRAVSGPFAMFIGYRIDKYPLLRWVIGTPDAGKYQIQASVSYLSADSQR